jgi:hypothetical protein
MSPPEVWGPAIWRLFHTLAEKVNEEAFPFIKFQLFGQIKRICSYLPCPECSADATIFLAKININDIKNKTDFKKLFYLFHNHVNAKKRKPLYNYSNLSLYNNYRFVHVLNNFISNYNTKGNMNLIAESFQRKLIVNDFKAWITKYIRAFTPPPPIPETILDIIVVEEPVIVVTEEPVIVVTEEPVIVVTEEPVIVVTEEPVIVITEEPVIVE